MSHLFAIAFAEKMTIITGIIPSPFFQWTANVFVGPVAINAMGATSHSVNAIVTLVKRIPLRMMMMI